MREVGKEMRGGGIQENKERETVEGNMREGRIRRKLASERERGRGKRRDWERMRMGNIRVKR